jgi:SP family general alpha glucoside:H+ symporter-like MFS transporter
MEDIHPSQHSGFITVAPEISQASDKIKLQMDPTCLDIPYETRSGPMDLFPRLSAAVPGFQHLTVSAGAATRAEQKMTFLGGCELYPKAIAWSIVLSSAIIMEGYGTTLIFSFFTLPGFCRLYGQLVNGQGSYQISSAWQAGLANGAVVGEIIGLFINGILSDRVGYRRIMIGALVFLSLSIFLAFFAVNIYMLLAAQILCGKPPSRNIVGWI